VLDHGECGLGETISFSSSFIVFKFWTEAVLAIVLAFAYLDCAEPLNSFYSFAASEAPSSKAEFLDV